MSEESVAQDFSVEEKSFTLKILDDMATLLASAGGSLIPPKGKPLLQRRLRSAPGAVSTL